MLIILVVPIIGITQYNNNKLVQYFEDEIIATAMDNLLSIKNLNENIIDKVKTEVITLAKSKSISQISRLKNLSQVLSDTDSFVKIKEVERLLNEIVYGDDNIYSIYLYLDGGDYVITSKNGIMHLDYFRDTNWLDKYEIGLYGKLGKWEARKAPYTLNLQLDNTGETDVVTYVYPLSSITTSARGVIVVNLYEYKFADLINSSALDDSSNYSFIIDKDGYVISHGDKDYFMKNISALTIIDRILKSNEQEGCMIEEDNGDKNLYVYAKEPQKKWVYIRHHSLNAMMQKVNNIKKVSTLWLVLITGFALLLSFIISVWISKPLKKLVNHLKNIDDLSFENKKNEIELLTTAFQQMDTQRKKLYSILEKSQDKAEELFLNDLLRGNLDKYKDEELNKSVFPYANFTVAIIDIDNKESFVNKYTSEQRYYYKTWILNKCRDKLGQFFVVKGLVYMEYSIALIMNFDAYHPTKTLITIKSILEEVLDETEKELNLSFSAGIGRCYGGYSGIKASATEAITAYRHKLLVGNRSIILWDKSMTQGSTYFYPYDKEKHIINCLYAKKAEDAKFAVKALIDEIRNMENISYDNIMQIFNQLVGVTIRYLVKNNINISQIFDNVYVVSHQISNLDTLDDVENYLMDFYQKIIDYIIKTEKEEGDNHLDRILSYINENYHREIDFKEMAKEIGISYSYMRKIVKQETGKSLLDLINNARIEKAKVLLRETSMYIKEIAEDVGYNNVQSFTRFFKKYEGITPSEFREIKE